MVKKYLSFIVCCVLLITANASLICAQTGAANKDSSSAAKIKARVIKRSSGNNSFVKVKMLDGKKLSGEITQTGEDSFTLTDSKTKQSTTIAYRVVAQVKGKGLSTTSKIGIGVLAGAAAILLTIVLIPICNEGGC